MNAQSTLVSRHTLWLASGFTALALGLAALFTALVAWPMANRAADDLAGLLVLSAQTWAELPPETRDSIEEMLLPYQDGIRDKMLDALPIETRRKLEEEKRKLAEE